MVPVSALSPTVISRRNRNYLELHRATTSAFDVANAAGMLDLDKPATA